MFSRKVLLVLLFALLSLTLVGLVASCTTGTEVKESPTPLDTAVIVYTMDPTLVIVPTQVQPEQSAEATEVMIPTEVPSSQLDYGIGVMSGDKIDTWTKAVTMLELKVGDRFQYWLFYQQIWVTFEVVNINPLHLNSFSTEPIADIGVYDDRSLFDESHLVVGEYDQFKLDVQIANNLPQDPILAWFYAELKTDTVVVTYVKQRLVPVTPQLEGSQRY